MELLLVAGLFILNLLITWWNAKQIGSTWFEAKIVGGWRRFMSWMGAVMVFCGVTWCLSLVVGVVLLLTNVLPPDAVGLMLEICFVVMAPCLLVSLYAITLDSWRIAFQTGRLGDTAIAGWNTFATIYDTAQIADGIGPALGDIFEKAGKVASGDDEAGCYIMAGLIALAILASSATITALLIHYYALREKKQLIANYPGYGAAYR